MNFCYVTNFTQGGVDCYASIDIRITRFYEQRPDYGADNPDDFYGYTDIDWEVENIEVFLEDTGEFLYSECTQDLEKYGLQYEEVEDWLLTQIEGIKGEWYD